MQTIVCEAKECGFRSKSGFCLNRFLVINSWAVCNYFATNPERSKPVPEEQKITNFWKNIKQEEEKEKQGQIKTIEEKGEEQ